MKYFVLPFVLACTTPGPSEELDDLRTHHDVDCGWTSIDPPPMGVQCQNTVATCLPNAMSANQVAVFAEVHGRGPDWDTTYTITRDHQVLSFSDARCDDKCDDRLGYLVSRSYCTGFDVTMQGGCATVVATGCSDAEIER